MDSPRPTLLQAAKAFIAKSTKAAAVIAPLALASVPTEAEAQVVFGPVTSTSALIIAPSGGQTLSYTAPDWFTRSLSPHDGFAGQQFGTTYTFTNLHVTGSELTARIQFHSAYGSSGWIEGDGVQVPFAYGFSISGSEGITLHSWSVSAYLHGSELRNLGGAYGEFGSERAGTFSGLGDVFTGTEQPVDLQPDGYYVELSIFFDALAPTDTLNITMDPSEGFALGSNSLSAIPEPSTYAVLFGLTALGYAAYRRRRTA